MLFLYHTHCDEVLNVPENVVPKQYTGPILSLNASLDFCIPTLLVYPHLRINNIEGAPNINNTMVWAFGPAISSRLQPLAAVAVSHRVQPLPKHRQGGSGRNRNHNHSHPSWPFCHKVAMLVILYANSHKYTCESTYGCECNLCLKCFQNASPSW